MEGANSIFLDENLYQPPDFYKIKVALLEIG